MSRLQFNSGDEVIITKKLKNSQTERRYTIAEGMWDMQGKVYKIGSADSDSVLIKCDTAKRNYRFHYSDITHYTGAETNKLFLKDSKKHTFDPSLLDVNSGVAQR